MFTLTLYGSVARSKGGASIVVAAGVAIIIYYFIYYGIYAVLRFDDSTRLLDEFNLV